MLDSSRTRSVRHGKVSEVKKGFKKQNKSRRCTIVIIPAMGNENRTVEWDGINSGSVVAHGEERGRGRRGGRHEDGRGDQS